MVDRERKKRFQVDSCCYPEIYVDDDVGAAYQKRFGSRKWRGEEKGRKVAKTYWKEVSATKGERKEENLDF